MFALRPSPSPTLSTTPLSYHISPPSSYPHTPLLTFDSLPLSTMGDNIDAPPLINTQDDNEGWLELARLRQELEDAKKVIMALQNLAVANAAAPAPVPEPKVPKWKENAPKKGPKMAKPDAFSGKMDETESFVNACTMYILGQANDFPDETAAIMWVLSYMKEGSAREWRDEYLKKESLGTARLRISLKLSKRNSVIPTSGPPRSINCARSPRVITQQTNTCLHSGRRHKVLDMEEKR